MKSVTDVIKQINQPKDGFLPIKLFDEKTSVDTSPIICSIKPLYVGKIIDDILHEIIRSDYSKVFRDEIDGYNRRVDWFAKSFSTGNWKSTSKQRYTIIEEDLKKHVEIEYMLSKLKLYAYENDLNHMLNETYGIVQYSIWKYDFNYISNRSTVENSRPKGLKKSDLNKLKSLTSRTLSWITSAYKDRIIPDFKFYPNGYSEYVKYGVGDFVCDNTLYDIKCIDHVPTIENTLQILIYYCMGLHSDNKLYKDIDKIGIYSPIVNTEWIVEVKDIPKESISKILSDVLIYKEE